MNSKSIILSLSALVPLACGEKDDEPKEYKKVFDQEYVFDEFAPMGKEIEAIDGGWLMPGQAWGYFSDELYTVYYGCIWSTVPIDEYSRDDQNSSYVQVSIDTKINLMVGYTSSSQVFNLSLSYDTAENSHQEVGSFNIKDLPFDDEYKFDYQEISFEHKFSGPIKNIKVSLCNIPAKVHIRVEDVTLRFYQEVEI